MVREGDRIVGDEITEMVGFSRELICSGYSRFYLYRNRRCIDIAEGQHPESL